MRSQSLRSLQVRAQNLKNLHLTNQTQKKNLKTLPLSQLNLLRNQSQSKNQNQRRKKMAFRRKSPNRKKKPNQVRKRVKNRDLVARKTRQASFAVIVQMRDPLNKD